MLFLLPALIALSSPTSDVCALLQDADIRAAVGERVTARTPAASQCQFTTSGTHAVSLMVGVREAWQQSNHGKTPAQRIAGVGDEAYWAGGPIAGALYVLRGDTYVRVSVGGYRTEHERIERSRKLAESVLKNIDRDHRR